MNMAAVYISLALILIIGLVSFFRFLNYTERKQEPLKFRFFEFYDQAVICGRMGDTEHAVKNYKAALYFLEQYGEEFLGADRALEYKLKIENALNKL